eukprot:g23205.t1
MADPMKFRNVEVLAPMVRAGTLPLRLECLRYGASLVYGEEIIDRKLIGAQRVENHAFGCIDYVSPRDPGLIAVRFRRVFGAPFHPMLGVS